MPYCQKRVGTTVVKAETRHPGAHVERVHGRLSRQQFAQRRREQIIETPARCNMLIMYLQDAPRLGKRILARRRIPTRT